jgi:hypothetical protein
MSGTQLTSATATPEARAPEARKAQQLSTIDAVELDALRAKQHGLLHRSQVEIYGYDRLEIRIALDLGRWRVVLPAVYLTLPMVELTDERKRIAAYLYTRSTGQITGASALAWHGLRPASDRDGVHVLVPHETRRPCFDFVRVQRTRRLDPKAKQADAGYQVCSPTRALADLCRSLSELRDVQVVVTHALRCRWTTPEELEDEAIHAGNSRTRALRLALKTLS